MTFDFKLKFSEWTWFTIALVAIALVGGIVALIKRDKAKQIMIATGIAALGVIIAAVITFIVKGNAAVGFEWVDVKSTIFALIVALLVIIMFVFLIISGKNVKWGSRDLSYAIICLAISFILSFIRLFRMPQGGSVTPAQLLPLIVYISVAGPMRGIVVAIAFGLLQLLQGAYVVHPMQLLLDYPVAYGAIALAGIVKYVKLPDYCKLPLAVIIAYASRFIPAFLSGAIYFPAPDGWSNGWIYSLAYNGTYIGIECAICFIITLIPPVNSLRNFFKTKLGY